jgi:small subunit ribosomal protein S2
LTKKEIAALGKERSRLQKNLGGLKEMKDPPGVLFIIDTRKEAIAVTEAKRMNIPIVSVVDTNCNPDGINFPIPGNDDAIRAITLFTQIIANAVVEADNEAGLKIIETLGDDEEDMEGLMTDVSLKEEDQEVDIASYASADDTAKTDSPIAPPPDEEDDLPVNVDKVYETE